MNSFFASSHYAVVGASTNRAKYGNRVLRWCVLGLPARVGTQLTLQTTRYLDHNLPVDPINPREAQIEGLPVLSSLTQLKDPASTSISVITPPAVTARPRALFKRKPS